MIGAEDVKAWPSEAAVKAAASAMMKQELGPWASVEPEHGIWRDRARVALTVAVPELAAEVVRLRTALRQCEMQFRFYADEHTAAGKTEKAATNRRFEALCSAALAPSPEEGA